MSKSVIINDINNASPNVTTHIIPAIRAINKGSNYDDLGNKPVYNINLLEEGFDPIEGEYYRHTGETTDTFTTGVIYYYKEGKYTPITGSEKGASNFACTGILEKSKWVDKSITYTEPKSLKYYDVSSYTEEVTCAGIKKNVLYQFNSKGYYKTDLENPNVHEFISWDSTNIGEESTGQIEPIMCTTSTVPGYGEALFISCGWDGHNYPIMCMVDVPGWNLFDYILTYSLPSKASSIAVIPDENNGHFYTYAIQNNTKLVQYSSESGFEPVSVDLPERIIDSNLCIYNNELYITGGSIKNIYKFNFTTKEITKVCTVPDYFGPFLIDAPCYAIVINNKIYGIDTSNNLVVYDMNGTKIGEVPKIINNEDYTYFYCALIYHNNDLYISYSAHSVNAGNPAAFCFCKLKDIRYEYSIENDGIEENSAASISLNSNYPIIDATKTQGKISLISNNTPDDNKYSIIQVPTKDTGILEVLNTYKAQKVSELENDAGFLNSNQVFTEIAQFNVDYQPDWTSTNKGSPTYIKNKDNVNYTLTESDWTSDCFSSSNITLITADGEHLSNYYDLNDDDAIIQGKITLDGATKDVLVRRINYSLTEEFKHLVNNSIFYTTDGIIYKQLILNGIPENEEIAQIQCIENPPTGDPFLWVIHTGDERHELADSPTYESSDGVNYTVSERFKGKYRLYATDERWMCNLSSRKYDSSSGKYYQTLEQTRLKNDMRVWETITFYVDKDAYYTDVQVCRDEGKTYFMLQSENTNVIKQESSGEWRNVFKPASTIRFNLIRSVGDYIFVCDTDGNLLRAHIYITPGSTIDIDFPNNLGKPKSTTNIDSLKYFNGNYIYCDEHYGTYYIYNFGANFESNPTFNTATKYISHGDGMPKIEYCINGRYLGLLSSAPASEHRYTNVVYTDVLQNPQYSRIVFDRYFTHNYLQNNTDSKIRLYKYKSAHNISRDEETGNFYSKYGEKPTIYITAIPAAARFDLLVNEYAEV